MGLPFSFASHFAQDMLWHALRLYREHFTPSPTLAQSYAMVCINVIAADSERDARFLFTLMQQQFINLRRGRPGAAAGGGYRGAVVTEREIRR